MNIPLLVPSMPSAQDLLPWLEKIDHNRWYTNYGPLNAQFERELARHIPCAGELALTTVSNCTLGLELALTELGLAPGARVLIPAITFVATGTAVLRAGFVPVLADVDQDTWIMTPDIARRALASTPFDAVMPVSTFGLAQDVAAWDEFSLQTGLPVVIDAAGAMGNQGVGQRTTVVFSLHATKSLGCGEGGVVASQDAALIGRIRRATNFGIDLESPIGESHGGTNAKLSEYHAAVGLAALPLWQSATKARSELYGHYREEIVRRRLAVTLQVSGDMKVRTLFIVRMDGCGDISRVVAHLGASGIGARRWYCPPLHHHSVFSACPVAGSLTVSERLGCELIGLPFYPGLGEAEVTAVVGHLVESLSDSPCVTAVPVCPGTSSELG